MEVSSEEEAAHMLANRLALTKDFAWKIGWFCWNLSEMSPLTPGETPKNQEGQVFP